MKRFRFRLESVRNLRDLAERRAREAFAVAVQKFGEAEEAWRAAAARRRTLVEGLADARGGTFRPGEQIAGIAALRHAERLEQEASRHLAEAEGARARAREFWLTARQQLQVIEKLEERARTAHRDEADKAEQTLLDELASLSAARAAHAP